MKDSVLYAGYGRCCLNPDGPATLCGYAHPNRIIQEIKDDIYSSCTALRDGEGNTALIFSIDLAAVYEGTVAAIKKALSEELGINEDLVILNATHNHAGTMPSVEFLTPRVISSARDALADLSKCEIYVGKKEVFGFNFCRRFLTRDGKLFDHDTRPMIWSFETEADHVVPLIKITREGKKSILLANFAAHNDTIYGCEGKYYTLSADYVGATRTYFEEHTDSYLSIQMGACGDVNPVNTPFPFYSFPGTDVYGKHLALAFIDGTKELQKLEGDMTIRSAKATFKAFVNHSNDDKIALCQEIMNVLNGGDTKRANKMALENGFKNVYECGAIITMSSLDEYHPFAVSALSVGDIGFAVAPYEMFNDTGVQIKEASKFGLTFVCAYSNGHSGYIPTKKAFDNGGYEAYTCYYYPGTAEDIGDTLVGLLDEIYEKKN